MTETKMRAFIQDRARILAMVQFTSRADLEARDFPQESGLDLLVQIVPDGPGYQKFFGVQLIGINQQLPDAEVATRYLANASSKRKLEGDPSPKYSFPVIFLLFSMANDKGYFAWSIEPIVNRAGEPKLKVHESLSCAPFNRSSLKTIVNRVNEWHDSLVALLETA
jgi:hypothetical protein